MSAQRTTFATAQTQNPTVSLAIVFILGLALGGAGVVAYYSQRQAIVPLDANNAEQTAQKAAGKPQPRFVTLKPLVANLFGSKGTRHLKITAALKTYSPEVFRELEARTLEITDRLLERVRQVTIDDIDSKDGGNKLKREMVQDVNELLEKGSVDEVLFTEFVVQ